MDVEGAEHLAVQGMLDLLHSHHPDLIVEVSRDFLTQMGSSAEALCAVLLDTGYRMYVIDWDRLKECPVWRDTLPAQFNALFTARQRLPPGLPVESS